MEPTYNKWDKNSYTFKMIVKFEVHKFTKKIINRLTMST